MNAEIRFSHRETARISLYFFAVFNIKPFGKLQGFNFIQRKIDSVIAPIFTRPVRKTISDVSHPVKVVVMEDDQMVVLCHH
ncbi:Uncharacterised protein [Salmonella enterica subsp. enterica serovar Typhi]|nr:Uncharacterised protein [Salmonella enterica subsp. enterica serovar Typhi]